MSDTTATIVFDLDGTLVDTAHDLIDSLNFTIAAHNLAPVTYDDITHLVGHGARVMIERAFALRGIDLPAEALPAMMQRFVAHYGENMPGHSRPFDGLTEALEQLRQAGYRLAVCTNKMESLARPLIESLGLSGHFAAISGGDTFAQRKPHGDHIRLTVEMAGGDPSEAVMVGDSINDILGARNAGVPSIAVPFGYSDVPVEELGATCIIASYNELTPELVGRLLSSR
ncbi:phosphoglycolate phosphatase [Rhizobium halophytocola]|uniref:Phosphoglycolate phosphatase n=1 Tax=Rhizobium halophytocola TaxID=735519 RepID=A0ABS4DZ50_9HYPH|nr:phosphoglycolate phosphatase [Rhizobium halophytocola]MBP1850964.1 phosphoglycolate phosphatase [Rhizobium halophytocola]